MSKIIIFILLMIFLIASICLAESIQLNLSEDGKLLGGRFIRVAYGLNPNSGNWALGEWQTDKCGNCHNTELSFFTNGRFEFRCQVINKACEGCPEMVDNLREGGTYRLINENTLELYADWLPNLFCK